MPKPYEELGGVWGKNCPKHTTINTWLGSSDAPGPILVENESGRQKSSTNHNNVVAAYDMVMSAPRVTLVQIVDALGCS